MSRLPTDFSNHPKSIGEIRSTLEHDGSKWSPRDVLIELLRDMDAGKIAVAGIFVAWGEKGDNGSVSTHFAAASPNRWEALGLLECAKAKFLEG